MAIVRQGCAGPFHFGDLLAARTRSDNQTGFQRPLESGISGRAMTAEHLIEIGIAIAIAVLVARFLWIGRGE